MTSANKFQLRKHALYLNQYSTTCIIWWSFFSQYTVPFTTRYQVPYHPIYQDNTFSVQDFCLLLLSTIFKTNQRFVTSLPSQEISTATLNTVSLTGLKSKSLSSTQCTWQTTYISFLRGLPPLHPWNLNRYYEQIIFNRSQVQIPFLYTEYLSNSLHLPPLLDINEILPDAIHIASLTGLRFASSSSTQYTWRLCLPVPHPAATFSINSLQSCHCCND